MTIFLYVIAGGFILYGASIALAFMGADRFQVSLLLGGSAFVLGGIMAINETAWWPLPAGFSIALIVRKVFGDPGFERKHVEFKPINPSCLEFVVADFEKQRISRAQFLEILQDGIDNGDAVSDENQVYFAKVVQPLLDDGVLKPSEHTKHFERVMNEKVAALAKNSREQRASD